MSTLQVQQNAWTAAIRNPVAQNDSPSLGAVSKAIATLLLTTAISVAILMVFGAHSSNMAVSGLSVFLIPALMIWAMERKTQKTVEGNFKTTPIMNKRLMVGASLVVVAALIGHAAGFALTPIITSLM